MPYQGGQRSAKRTQQANWTPTFPGANFLFGSGPFFAGRGAKAAIVQPTVEKTPFELAPIGTPFIKNGILGYKGPYSQVLGKNLWMPRGDMDAGPNATPAAKPAAVPAGIVQPAAIVSGLTPAGEVDRSQSDEYKSQMAQYRSLIDKKQQQEAEDLGMKIWMEKYGKTPMAQAGGAVGTYNPLLAEMFPDTKGYAGTFAPVEEVQMGDLGTRAQGEFGPTMESLGLLNKQAAQQEATAAQADMATTAGASASERAQNLTRAFRLGLI
jgi:hypothetical protein